MKQMQLHLPSLTNPSLNRMKNIFVFTVFT